MPKKKTAPPIELDELLAAEFNYIVQTATQANEDRARIASFYLIAVGSLVATILGTQFFDLQQFTPTAKLLFSGIFILLTLMGTSTIVQLARLRASWYESMLAMNQLKGFRRMREIAWPGRAEIAAVTQQPRDRQRLETLGDDLIGDARARAFRQRAQRTDVDGVGQSSSFPAEAGSKIPDAFLRTRSARCAPARGAPAPFPISACRPDRPPTQRRSIFTFLSRADQSSES